MVKNFSLPQSEVIVSQPERREGQKGEEQLSVAKLKVFLDQMNEGKWSLDQMVVESATFHKARGQEDEEEERVKVDYTSKQVDSLRKKYQDIASEVNAFMVQQGQWEVYSEEALEINMPTHLLSEEVVEDKLTGVPMSVKCCSHMEKVFSSKEDLKASKADGLVQVWQGHFAIIFWTPCTCFLQ